MTDIQAGHIEEWPALRVQDWAETRDTLHMWTQIVGKIRLMQAPMVNHWWQVPLYVSARGLTTSAIPFEDDHEHASYDPVAAQRFWQQLLAAHRVLTEFRSRAGGRPRPKSRALMSAEAVSSARRLR